MSDPDRLSSAEIESIVRKVKTLNKILLKETKLRNVLVLGNPRSGKSAMIGVLKSPMYKPEEEWNSFAARIEFRMHSFDISDKDADVRYSLRLVEAPYVEEMEDFDQFVTNAIGYCVKNEMMGIHVLMMTVSLENDVDRDQVEKLKMSFEKFQHDDLRIVMCITHAESGSGEKGLRLDELQNIFKSLIESEKLKFQFSGCVDPSADEKRENMVEKYKCVSQMRMRTLEEIFRAEKQVNFEEIPFISNQVSLIQITLNQQLSMLTQFEEIKDWNEIPQEMHKSISEFADNLDVLSKGRATIMVKSDLSSMFQEMKKKVESLSKQVPPKFRKVLIGPLDVE